MLLLCVTVALGAAAPSAVEARRSATVRRVVRGKGKTGRCRKLFRACVLAAAMLATPGMAKAQVPQDVNNVCSIFREQPAFYEGAVASEKKWGVPVGTQLSIIRHESGFDKHARPPPKKVLGVSIPFTHQSTAYGYPQALDGTWERYKRETGRSGAKRTDPKDATDFVGWYVDMTSRELGISKNDAYKQYLAYHVGQSGYRAGDYNSGHEASARRVRATAAQYQQQYDSCATELAKPKPTMLQSLGNTLGGLWKRATGGGN